MSLPYSSELVDAMAAALRPFAIFAEKFADQPINNLADDCYSIHGGDICPPKGATFRISDCDKARAALAAYEALQEPSSSEPEIVDPVTQLAMSLQWDDDYSDEYKVRVLSEAIRFIAAGECHTRAGDAPSSRA